MHFSFKRISECHSNNTYGAESSPLTSSSHLKFEMYCLEDNPLRCSISFSRGSSRHKTKTNTCTFKLAQVPPLPDLTHPTDSLLNTYRIIERHIYTYTYINIYIHIHTYICTHIYTNLHPYTRTVFIHKEKRKKKERKNEPTDTPLVI